MLAFGRLPFQFQQRGDVLAETIAKQDSKTLQQHLTKRDQDLENYLSTLKGARVSEASFTIPNTNVVTGSGPQALPLTFVVGINGLEHADTAGFVPLDTAATAVICIIGVELAWSHIPGTTIGGMAQVFGAYGAAILSDFVIPTQPGPTLTFVHGTTQVDQIPTNTALGATSAVVQVTDTLPDITTSGGPMGGIGALAVTGAVFLYVVD